MMGNTEADEREVGAGSQSTSGEEWVQGSSEAGVQGSCGVSN